MAFAFDGFSIREYTSKMRSVDVLKCWPFGTTSSGDVAREELESCLPPMTIPKYRRRSDELDTVRSDHDDCGESENQAFDDEISRSVSELVKSEKSTDAEEEKFDMVCPVCRDFNAATLTAVNAHIDGCLAQTMRDERRHMRMMSLKSKSKGPKKRSIAEIFEVDVEQPRIQTVMKFWPLNKNPDEVSITVTKFRWLSRQLEALRSNQLGGETSINESASAKSDDGSGREEDKLEMVCPICRDFNAATVTAVNAHMDGCLAQALREERRHMRMNLRAKPKAPKKRSIAEILTVAPQIEAKRSELINIDKEEEEETQKSEGGGDLSRSGAAAAAAVVSTISSKKNTDKNRKKIKMERWKKNLKEKGRMEKYRGTVTPNNEKKTMNRKNKNFFNNGLYAKKEEASKYKVQTPVDSARKLKGTIGNRRVLLDDINASAHKKEASTKYVCVEKKQKPVPPTHGILKNHSTHNFGKTSSGCDTQDGTEERPCDVQELTSARHVGFSSKDDILRPKKRSSFDEMMFSLSSDGQSASLVKKQSSGSDDEASSSEVNRSDGNIVLNEDREKEVCPIVESEQFSNAPTPRTNEEKTNHLVEKSESLTQVTLDDNNNSYLFDRGDTSSIHTGISQPLSALQAGNISRTDTQVGDSGTYSGTGNFIDHLGNSTHQVAAMNSDANTRTFLQPSSLYSTSYNQAYERSVFPLQTYGDSDYSRQALGYRPLSHMFSADMMDNSFPFPGRGKGTVRSNCVDENFFGLPLNSQGELINVSSSGNGGINQSETSSMLRSSSSGLPVTNIACESSWEYLNINERHFVHKDQVNQFQHYPARLGVTELQGSDGADIPWPSTERSSNNYVHQLDSELNLMKYPFVEQNHRDQVQNHKGNGMVSLKESSNLSQSSTQPTMRLMGKDVPIGRSVKEMQDKKIEVGDVWAHHQSRRHHSEDAASENSSLERCSKQDYESASPFHTSTENVTESVKFQSNQASLRTLLLNGPDSEFPKPFLDLQTGRVSQSGTLRFGKISNSYSHLVTHPHTSCAVINSTPGDLPEQLIFGAKPLELGSHLQVQPATCSYSQCTCLSNGGLNDRKKLPVVTNSAFEFPFAHPAVGQHAKTSWFQSSCGSLPHEKLPGVSSQQISGPSSKSFPHNIRGDNSSTLVNYSAEVLNPLSPLTSRCHMKTPVGPASVVQLPLVPIRPAISVNDRVNLDDKTTKDHRTSDNTRKRPAAKLDESTKPSKFQNVEVTGLIRESSSSEFQRITTAADLDPRGDGARSYCCFLNEAQHVNPPSYGGFQSLNLDGTVISGPVRPSPGARHILKPSPNVDQDNSRPIQPAIPIAATTTDSSRELDNQRKLTRTYRF